MVDLYIFLGLLGAGYVFGSYAEARHFASIKKREKLFKSVMTFNQKNVPEFALDHDGVLVGGNVVISIDYFKQVAAGLRGIVGGRVKAYESLVERARREAMLRMKEEARMKGAKLVINVRLETSSIAKGAQGQVGSVEVYAYGTALIAPKIPIDRTMSHLA